MFVPKFQLSFPTLKIDLSVAIQFQAKVIDLRISWPSASYLRFEMCLRNYNCIICKIIEISCIFYGINYSIHCTFITSQFCQFCISVYSITRRIFVETYDNYDLYVTTITMYCGHIKIWMHQRRVRLPLLLTEWWLCCCLYLSQAVMHLDVILVLNKSWSCNLCIVTILWLFAQTATLVISTWARKYQRVLSERSKANFISESVTFMTFLQVVIPVERATHFIFNHGCNIEIGFWFHFRQNCVCVSVFVCATDKCVAFSSGICNKQFWNNSQSVCVRIRSATDFRLI